MKKLILLLFVLGSVFGTIETAHAGWSTTRRSGCWFLSKRYVAQAHLAGWACRWGYAWSKSANCSGASVWIGRYYGCCYAQSQVHAYSYNWGQGGWLHRPCWGVSGAELTDMMTDAGFAAERLFKRKGLKKGTRFADKRFNQHLANVLSSYFI